MEIHKPKPWHGWREFVKEYAIIVLGVLTALAAEQIAGVARHHAEAQDMAGKLQAESRDNARVIAFDVAMAESMAKAVRGEMETAPAAGAAAAAGLPEHVYLARPGDAAWVAARDSGRLPIMPKLLTDNYWKIDSTDTKLEARAADLLKAYQGARAAADAARRAPGSVALGDDLRLRLADAAEDAEAYLFLARLFQRENARALAGQAIDLDIITEGLAPSDGTP